MRPLGCNSSLAPSRSAVVRTLNFTRGYMQQTGRSSEHVVLEQWQPYPNVTGPEQEPDTNMWMATHAAAAVRDSAL